MQDNAFKRLSEVASTPDILATQAGIIQFATAAARVLAEAGFASSRALGDSPSYAVRKWADVIKAEALDIVEGRAKKQKKQQLMPPV